MTEVIPFDAHRFRSAAAHYLAGRPPYAALLIERVAAAAGLSRTDRVLDLGCGPGQLAVAFAPRAAEVIGVDPEPAMLEAAAENAATSGVTVRLIEGSSYDLDASLGNFKLVTIGRAFHWMDRADTLRRLDNLVVPDGTIALFADRHPEVPDNRWWHEGQRLVNQYTDADAERKIRRSATFRRHEAVLLDSAFGRLERISIIERRRVSIESLLDRILSMSVTSSDRLGARTEALVSDIRAMLTPVADGGMITEVVESEALLARR